MCRSFQSAECKMEEVVVKCAAEAPEEAIACDADGKPASADQFRITSLDQWLDLCA